MTLIRAHRLYQEYLLTQLLPNPNHYRALDEREVNPLALVPYQEPSLSQAHPAHTEIEDLARVRHVAQPYVDMLLHRWTRLEEMNRACSKALAPEDHPLTLTAEDGNTQP
jgi:hypothetical protein